MVCQSEGWWIAPSAVVASAPSVPEAALIDPRRVPLRVGTLSAGVRLWYTRRAPHTRRSQASTLACKSKVVSGIFDLSVCRHDR